MTRVASASATRSGRRRGVRTQLILRSTSARSSAPLDCQSHQRAAAAVSGAVESTPADIRSLLVKHVRIRSDASLKTA